MTPEVTQLSILGKILMGSEESDRRDSAWTKALQDQGGGGNGTGKELAHIFTQTAVPGKLWANELPSL